MWYGQAPARGLAFHVGRTVEGASELRLGTDVSGVEHVVASQAARFETARAACLAQSRSTALERVRDAMFV